MLLDVLSGLPELKLCTAYELDGQRRTHFPSDAYQLEQCMPVYETIPGWKEDITGVRKLADLPTGAALHRPRE